MIDRKMDNQTDSQTVRQTDTLASIATYSVKLTEYKKTTLMIAGNAFSFW